MGATLDQANYENSVYFKKFWHKDSLEVITKLGRQVSRQTGKEEDEIVRQLRQRMAILLVKNNVNMFNPRTPLYPQAVIDADKDINV